MSTIDNNRSDANLVRRDLQHATDRREKAEALRAMVEWMLLSGRETNALLVRVPEHTSFFGMRHKERSLELTGQQEARLREFLKGEAVRAESDADRIESQALRPARDWPMAA